MAVKQATVAQEELQWSQLPKDWPLILKEDWQNKTNGISEVAEVANEANVTASNEAETNKNQDISISQNRESIKEVSGSVSRLTSVVSKNAADIETNANGISENKQAIENNAQNLTDHEAETTAHGVTGNNVGTEDFAQELVGGVVLIAANIIELTQYTAPTAPAAYDQTEEQAFRDGVQSEINKLVLKVNEIVQGQITAKQMSPNVPTP